LLSVARANRGSKIRLECCDACGFDLRQAISPAAPDGLLAYEASYEKALIEDERGTDTPDKLAVLRHLVTLLFGENRGLENLRRAVASHSGITRVDLPVPYGPDEYITPFEEAEVFSRLKVSLAAHWLFQYWPSRFIWCCREARVQYPALNRNAITIHWYCEAAIVAYGGESMSNRQHPAGESGVSDQPRVINGVASC
jgi:hypothetical protein